MAGETCQAASKRAGDVVGRGRRPKTQPAPGMRAEGEQRTSQTQQLTRVSRVDRATAAEGRPQHARARRRRASSLLRARPPAHEEGTQPRGSRGGDGLAESERCVLSEHMQRGGARAAATNGADPCRADRPMEPTAQLRDASPVAHRRPRSAHSLPLERHAAPLARVARTPTAHGHSRRPDSPAGGERGEHTRTP